MVSPVGDGELGRTELAHAGPTVRDPHRSLDTEHTRGRTRGELVTALRAR